MVSFLTLLALVPACLAKTVTYNWDITWVSANPDGLAQRPVIGINGQWPCPKIEVDEGDIVIVNARNMLGNETTSLHWHGMYQKGTSNMDGPSGMFKIFRGA